jgi:hypothetical protein
MSFAHQSATTDTHKPPVLGDIPTWAYIALVAGIAIGAAVYRLSALGPSPINWLVLALACLVSLIFAMAFWYLGGKSETDKNHTLIDINRLERRIDDLNLDIRSLPSDLELPDEDSAKERLHLNK